MSGKSSGNFGSVSGTGNFCAVLCVFLVFSGAGCQAREQVGPVDICDVCECNASDEDLTISCGRDLSEEFPALDKVEWPDRPADKVIVSFEGLGLTTVQKLARNDRVVFLSFSNNAIRGIWPRAFGDVAGLQQLRLAHNSLAEVTPDIFQGLAALRELDFSYNKLSDFNPLDFVELTNLETLILRGNKLTKIPVEALSNLPSLQELDLSENRLFELNFGQPADPAYILRNLKFLQLSLNKVTVVTKTAFQQAHKLEYLDLSDNTIASIEDDTFSDCSSLKELLLAHNSLAGLSSLPSSLLRLSLRHNSITSWPQLPDSLQELDFSKNQLTEIYNEKSISLNSLQVMNISGNMLSSMEITRPLPELHILDISYNHFQNVPAVLSTATFPSLDIFIVDGNPMKKLIFPSEIELKMISANFLSEVSSIDASSFVKVRGKTRPDLTEELSSICVDLSISNCQSLQIVHENSFQGIKLCHLDLSNNNLTGLSENVADWDSMTRGVNLQNNPWDCECSLQWMLDRLLKKLYTEHPIYLHELRCQYPRALQGLRLVHWYKRGENALCKGDQGLERSSNYVLMQSTNAESGVNIVMGSGTLFITILVCIIVGLLLVVSLIVYLVRGKYRHSHRVRRQMMKKRQEMTDAKKLNSVTKEQNEALNRV